MNATILTRCLNVHQPQRCRLLSSSSLWAPLSRKLEPPCVKDLGEAVQRLDIDENKIPDVKPRARVDYNTDNNPTWVLRPPNEVKTPCFRIPFSNRLRLFPPSVFLPAQWLINQRTYRKLVAASKDINLSKSHIRSVQVQKVFRRLTAHPIVRRAQYDGWELHVIDKRKCESHEWKSSAFTTCGGKVFITTEWWETLCRDDDVAAVVAHEIGHSIALHGPERITYSWIARVAGTACLWHVGVPVVAAFLCMHFVTPVLHAFVRRQFEHEADLIGLKLMAERGFDPERALVYRKWVARTAYEGWLPAFDIKARLYRTHPWDNERVSRLTALMPEARARFSKTSSRYGTSTKRR